MRILAGTLESVSLRANRTGTVIQLRLECHSPCATAGAAEDQRRKGHSREVAAASFSGHSACNVQRQPPSRGRFCPTETDPADEPFGTFQPSTGPPVPISSAGPPLLQRSRWMRLMTS